MTMEEVRQLVQEEGREARNLIAFHVAVDSPAPRIVRKPPRCNAVGPAGPTRPATRSSTTRLRSASAGRDKRSELQARYWALLFGNLHRAIDEIYTTVEAHENLSECQEVILVLENYMRDFKSLCEWFRLKWEYDNTPPPQRPQSLAWEVRKTDFVRPESRKALSVRSSPIMSGKNSPCLSGHNTPCLGSGKNSPNLSTGKASPSTISGKVSPRILPQSCTSPKSHSNTEFFANKGVSGKVHSKLETKTLSNPKLPDLKEVVVTSTLKSDQSSNENQNKKICPNQTNGPVLVETGIAKEYPSLPSPRMAVVKTNKVTPTNKSKEDVIDSSKKRLTTSKKEVEPSNQSKHTIETLNSMEDAFLKSQLLSKPGCEEKDILIEKTTPVEVPKEPQVQLSKNQSNKTIVPKPSHKVVENVDRSSDKLIKKEIAASVKKTDATKASAKEENNKVESKSNFNNTVKAPYSQAAAKPKSVVPGKTDSKGSSVNSTNAGDKIVVSNFKSTLTRSKTIAEIRQTPGRYTNFNRQVKRTANNKCSYPFNLTTGRSSIFNGQSSKILPNKTVSRNTRLASGDQKSTKAEIMKDGKKVESKGINPNNVGDGPIQKLVLKDTLKYENAAVHSSTDTIVNSNLELARMQSNESIKTLVPDQNSDPRSFTTSMEVLNVDEMKENDEDGWLTVKSKRLNRGNSKKQGKSHWANRFNQPSATTSLPTLNMIESPQETKPNVKECLSKNTEEESLPIKQPEPKVEEKLDENKETKILISPESKAPVKNVEKGKVKLRAGSLSTMIRQKSDVTGLKTRNSRHRNLVKHIRLGMEHTKLEDTANLCKNRLHSSLESLVCGLSRSQESTECDDCSMPLVTDIEKKLRSASNFDYLEDEDRLLNQSDYLVKADPVEMSEIAKMTSQIEENERKISIALDFQSEEDQKRLCEEEDLLNRQIQELQHISDIDLDTETDDTETDAEILCEEECCKRVDNVNELGSHLGPLAASLEDQYEPILAGLSWAERVDTLATLEALVARHPGRAQQLHAKLSAGIRRRGSLQETLKRYQAKQARAEKHRQDLLGERAKKLHQLLARVEDVKMAKNQLIEEKRLRMEQRLQKAAENRNQYLKDIVRKAHDEEEKLREIAFIKQLEAENRRHDFLAQCREQTGRLRQLRRDRLRRLEQAAAREAAVTARRRALEAARRLRVRALLERRRQQDARVLERREATRQRRHSVARERARAADERLSALAAAQRETAAALRLRIRDKQRGTEERHAKNLEAIRTRATQRLQTNSESQEICHKEEEPEPKENGFPGEVSKEKAKSQKKKLRKLRQKIISIGQSFETSHKIPPLESHLSKWKPSRAINQISALMQRWLGGNDSIPAKGGNDSIPAKGDSNSSSISDLSRLSCHRNELVRGTVNVNLLERLLNELCRCMEKAHRERNLNEKSLFHKATGIACVGDVLVAASHHEDIQQELQTKCLLAATSTLFYAVEGEMVNAVYLLQSNRIVGVVDLLVSVLKTLTASTPPAACPKRCQLAIQLCEVVRAPLDAVLRLSGEAAAGRTEKGGDLPVSPLLEFRQRAHMLVSYLALTGVVHLAESCEGAVRPHLLSVLAAAAGVAQHTPLDASNGEQPSAAAALGAALAASAVAGARGDLHALAADGAGDAGGVRAVLRLLRAAAELDYRAFQEGLSAEGAPVQFRAATARLLQLYAPALAQGDARPRASGRRNSAGEDRRRGASGDDQSELTPEQAEDMLVDLVTVVGYFVVNNERHQEVMSSGPAPGAARALAALPAGWLAARRTRSALLPAAAALAVHPRARAALAGDFGVEMLDEYLQSEEARDVKLVQLIKDGNKKKNRAPKS